MASVHRIPTASTANNHIDHNASVPPVVIPPGHVGEFVIPGTGKRVWWTGRVAIGLLHQPVRHAEAATVSSIWIQELMLTQPRRSGLAYIGG